MGQSIGLDTVAEFGWNFGSEFFLETANGNFIWSDPDYGGDNTIHPFQGSLEDYCVTRSLPFVRDKGKHTIRGYCGPDVEFVDLKGN